MQRLVVTQELSYQGIALGLLPLLADQDSVTNNRCGFERRLARDADAPRDPVVCRECGSQQLRIGFGCTDGSTACSRAAWLSIIETLMLSSGII